MSGISKLLLPWFDLHGRKNLPWQQQVTAYRVWLSEIMLQQTQVATVIPYFEKFLESFPTVNELADAHLDQVLSHWAGLGYYARARNLHKTAQIIRNEFDGEFPDSLDKLMALPGIGQSTAGAILSLSFGRHAAILDGNVKRVLSRLYQVEGWYGVSAVLKKLWKLAEQQTPSRQTAFYNQAMMDLGSMVCKRSNPDCLLCPLNTICQSYLAGTQTLFPTPKPKKARPYKHRWFLLHRYASKLLLERRPEQGIWGGLWSLPEIEQLDFLPDWQVQQIGQSAEFNTVTEKMLKHQFSHFDLSISLVEVNVSENFVKTSHSQVNESSLLQWIEWDELENIGLPAPIEKILSSHQTNFELS
ncbi:MAG: A/G-specific adenine glycosylase [Gammaproteobacteria bacterium]|jgi:A/G-specific adenine glycosylase|nr:A/G-specific adenine glycosylase [Gammaproteobacteria bacterium]MBT3725760.1 A/G-specific adenine glycosylase [Gammaproteobacteria bacterium]MBT4077523.1 A/G-specific adenine glycosylase [Gammaproteobacteria bacterium]MBT4196070.1 A/G-specific adenine glycosylase [Gammaproteobacteria bacterium]MBT4448817.1 A/G-specific adenine glycosylase [Gammaproteobacteria bacterium]